MNYETRPPSVLIVDDNPKNLQVLGGFLQNEGMMVEFAMDGNSALNWVQKQKFDLMLLDIMMPGMSGYEVCSEIKKNAGDNEAPVIFITAKTDSDSIVEGFNCGAVDYVTKPFIRSELLARVKTQIKIKRSADLIRQYLAEIEEKNRNITDSIRYAKNIQKAILDKPGTVKQLPENFVIFLPKDIVSGDFFWFNNLDETVVLAVMDCTGHGVPGALMSILGITLMNEIVNTHRILPPDKILGVLRDEIIQALGQKGEKENIKDSIEGSIVCYDRKNGKIQFSGSFNPLVLIRGNEIIEIKADRFPIGYFEIMKEFSLSEIKIKKDDVIYLYTDGYADQFGGPDKRKFTRKRFLELLHKHHAQPLDMQKKILSESFNRWKGVLNQTDDVLVAGFRF